MIHWFQFCKFLSIRHLQGRTTVRLEILPSSMKEVRFLREKGMDVGSGSKLFNSQFNKMLEFLF
jgi:hypothetical protein